MTSGGTLPLSGQSVSISVDGLQSTLAVASAGAAPGAALGISVPAARTRAPLSVSSSCPSYTPPTIDLTNNSSTPIVLTPADLQKISIVLLTQCNIVGQAYAVAIQQIAPSSGPITTVGTTVGIHLLGSVYALGNFKAKPNASFTFAPKTTAQLFFVPTQTDTSGNAYTDTTVVTIAPNTPVTLGAIPNTAGGTTSVGFEAQTTTGGNATVVCFPKSDPRFGNIGAQYVAAFPGTVKGACELYTGSSATIPVSGTVTFTITNPDPDNAHGLLEGPPIQVYCNESTANGTITATCPVPGNGFTIGAQSSQYEYFLFGNDPFPTTTVNLSPSWVSVVAGTASSGYTFALPTFSSYPVTMKIDGDVNNNLSMADGNAIPCTPGGTTMDMTQVAPGTLRVNCATGHQQGIIVSYNGNAWQYLHNGIAGQNQDCDASCVAYAAIDLYDATGTTLLQGDGAGATINGTSTALATINPLAINDPVTGALEDANGITINLPAADADPSGNTATGLKVTEANINALNATSVVFGLRQPTNGAAFGLNVYYGGSSFVTSGNPSLPVGSSSGLAHLPYGVGLNIQANALGGNGQLFISPPEPPGSHAPPSGIITIGIPQAGSTQTLSAKRTI